MYGPFIWDFDLLPEILWSFGLQNEAWRQLVVFCDFFFFRQSTKHKNINQIADDTWAVNAESCFSFLHKNTQRPYRLSRGFSFRLIPSKVAFSSLGAESTRLLRSCHVKALHRNTRPFSMRLFSKQHRQNCLDSTNSFSASGQCGFLLRPPDTSLLFDEGW